MLEFGTAGLRAKLGEGEDFLNLETIGRAAYGLALFCKSKIESKSNPPKIIIGYDARHHSFDFAILSAKIFQFLGVDSSIIFQKLPTPTLAYGLRKYNFDSAVMVTASHNPGEYNGYKVYLGGRIVEGWGQGSQIIAPYDTEIASSIAKSPQYQEIFDGFNPEFKEFLNQNYAKDATGDAIVDFDEFLKLPNANEILNLADPSYPSIELIDQKILDDYNTDLLDLIKEDPKLKDLVGTPKSNFKIVTTGMHGVGGQVQVDILKLLGFSEIIEVAEQKEPDPDFPTVRFPNPEEAGAMDIALEYARKNQADLVLANDPDADRLAVAVYDPYIKDYRALKGDETGSILGQYFADQIIAKYGPDSEYHLGSSIVSSQLLSIIAATSKVKYENTLTGFKFVSRIPHVVFGYEEAIGFNADPLMVHDKDGPSTGAFVALITYLYKSQGLTYPLIDTLDSIAQKYGLFTQSQVNFVFDDLSKIAEFVEKIRSNPLTKIYDQEVTKFIDFETNPPEKHLKTNLLQFNTKDYRIMMRPSGTEPKTKVYIEVKQDLPEHATTEQIAEIRKNSTLIHQNIGQFIQSLN